LPIIALATGTDSSIASKRLRAPSTLANGVRTPAASHTSGRDVVAAMVHSSYKRQIKTERCGQVTAYREPAVRAYSEVGIILREQSAGTEALALPLWPFCTT